MWVPAAASLAFYGYWDWHYVPLLVASATFNWFMARRLERSPRGSTERSVQLAAAIAANLLLLGYFKYANFFLTTFGTGWSLGSVVLPLGISFYTFTQIALSGRHLPLRAGRRVLPAVRDGDDAARRIVARRRLDFRDLGRAARARPAARMAREAGTHSGRRGPSLRRSRRQLPRPRDAADDRHPAGACLAGAEHAGAHATLLACARCSRGPGFAACLESRFGWALAIAAPAAIPLLRLNRVSEFLYYQF